MVMEDPCHRITTEEISQIMLIRKYQSRDSCHLKVMYKVRAQIKNFGTNRKVLLQEVLGVNYQADTNKKNRCLD
jgi:hypothetical protein